MAGGVFSASELRMLTPIFNFLRRGSARDLRSRFRSFRVTKTYPERKYGLVTPAMSRPDGASIATSQYRPFNALLKNPLRTGHQAYSTLEFQSFATSSAIFCSNPSPFWFERGMLSGSAQTLRTPAFSTLGRSV